MKTHIKWRGAVSFTGKTGSGHAIIMDGPPESGGVNDGPRPMELLLTGLGGCTAYDVITILKKARQDIQDCSVDIQAERAKNVPHVFTKIHIHFTLWGRNLSAKQVARALQLSADKYCSASIMLSKTAAITHDFSIQTTSDSNTD